MPKLTNEQLDQLIPFRHDQGFDEEADEPVMQARPMGMPAGSLALLDELKQALGIESDYRAADVLGVERSTVSKWRRGKGGMGDEVALKAAQLIGYDPAYVLLRLQYERTQSIGARHVLAKLIRQIERHNKATLRIASAVLTPVLFVLLGTLTPEPASAASVAGDAASPSMYIMANRRRRRRRPFFQRWRQFLTWFPAATLAPCGA